MILCVVVREMVENHAGGGVYGVGRLLRSLTIQSSYYLIRDEAINKYRTLQYSTFNYAGAKHKRFCSSKNSFCQTLFLIWRISEFRFEIFEHFTIELYEEG